MHGLLGLCATMQGAFAKRVLWLVCEPLTNSLHKTSLCRAFKCRPAVLTLGKIGACLYIAFVILHQSGGMDGKPQRHATSFGPCCCDTECAFSLEGFQVGAVKMMPLLFSLGPQTRVSKIMPCTYALPGRATEHHCMGFCAVQLRLACRSTSKSGHTGERREKLHYRCRSPQMSWLDVDCSGG